MKKLLFILSLLLPTLVFSQPYIPMLEEDNIWSLGRDVGWGFVTHFYHFDGEETLDGKVYKILHTEDYQTDCRWREENGVVYEYFDNSEMVLMDFTLDVGDTFTFLIELQTCFVAGAGNWFDYLQVTEVNTIFIAQLNRKVLTMGGFSNGQHMGYEELWIEGIGSTGQISPVGSHLDWIYSKLVCFTKNGETTDFNGFTKCVFVLSISEYSLEKVKLYPIPVVDTSYLNLPLELAIDRIRIFNMIGQLVIEDYITTDQYLIQNKDFSTGLYFYQVFSDGKLLKSEKFIIQ